MIIILGVLSLLYVLFRRNKTTDLPDVLDDPRAIRIDQ
jgi:hypothetical protein